MNHHISNRPLSKKHPSSNHLLPFLKKKIKSMSHQSEFGPKFSQKTVPIEHDNDNQSFFKDIAHKIKSKKCLYQIKQIRINKNARHINNQRSIANSTSANVKSLKEINLFRIKSKLNLRDNSQTKQQSLKHIEQIKQNNFISLRPKPINTINHNINNNSKGNYLLKSQSIINLPINQKITQCYFDMNEIQCSVINQKRQQINDSSFLSQSQKIMLDKMEISKVYQNKLGSKEIKMLCQQKSRKKLVEVEKLRKKFPQDFFKI